ncbi:MAG TPA: chromate transporter [Vineibacter sp.]|nr:chromate transporter [Vineibacter sp.]
MKDDLLLQVALTFASLSLVSIGGANVVVPEIHRQVVEQFAWMDDATFASLFAIAQAAPGPNVLLVSLVGWHVAGAAGLGVATIAILLPSGVLAFAAGRLITRWADTRWVAIAKAGMVPVAVGLILASGVVMARAADHDALGVAITAATALFVLQSDRNPLWALAIAMVVGVGAARLGLLA